MANVLRVASDCVTAASGSRVRQGTKSTLAVQQLTLELALVLHAIDKSQSFESLAGGYLKVAGASLLPQVGAYGTGSGATSNSTSGLNGLWVSASLELDIWGRIRYGQAAAQAVWVSPLESRVSQQKLHLSTAFFSSLK